MSASVFEEILTCKSGTLPMKYLGVPVDKKRLCLTAWRPTKDKMRGKLSPCQGKLLSIRGRTTLINSSLSSVPLYMLSFYRVPVGIRESMDSVRKNFLWNENEVKKKYHFVNWQVVCLAKDQGGLGILDLELMNIALQTK